MANGAIPAAGQQGAVQRALAFIVRWTTATNHKDIGTLYLCTALMNLFIGGTMAPPSSPQRKP